MATTTSLIGNTPATRPHHIYCLGINALDASRHTNLGPLPSIMTAITADLDRARRNGHPCTLQVLDGADLPASLAEFERRLTGMKDQIDAVMFGAGIRTKRDVVPFEAALNIVLRALGREEGVRILVNDGPDRHCAAIERGFGVVMEVD